MSEQSGSDEKWMKGKKSMGLKFVGNCMRGGEQIRKEGWEKRSGWKGDGMKEWNQMERLLCSFRLKVEL